ncbi:uncharacterized protein K02A2.6-like [Galendromus occidentalis]|uniref:Uncharacterized protein K02A2.6-like n=1 Tax=Galendromus occidentalis TaxID=34638 RepID=A0AAJ6QVS2_9ACAR|nr:uncharacterized protein K02A2.6-like [Galendromus occidentalis]
MKGEAPRLPWERASTDLMQYGGKNFLIVVDDHSFFWEIVPVNLISTNAILKALFSVSQHFGYPVTLRSDNDPQYASYEFTDTLKRFGINHVTSSPYYPRGKGLAERAVKEAKAILKTTTYGI